MRAALVLCAAFAVAAPLPATAVPGGSATQADPIKRGQGGAVFIRTPAGDRLRLRGGAPQPVTGELAVAVRDERDDGSHAPWRRMTGATTATRSRCRPRSARGHAGLTDRRRQ